MMCPECKVDTRQGATYCTQCGAKVRPVTCTECGSRDVAKSDIHCPVCGVELPKREKT